MKRPKIKKTRRRCLKCNRTFWSAGAHNRLCGRCNSANAGIRNDPGRPPLWNRKPMAVRREEDGLL